MTNVYRLPTIPENDIYTSETIPLCGLLILLKKYKKNRRKKYNSPPRKRSFSKF